MVKHISEPNSEQRVLKLLAEHPQEYIFIPRGRFVFDVPSRYFPSRLTDKADEIRHQYAEKSHRMIEPFNLRLSREPNLDFAANYGRKDSFCLFNPYDREVSSKLMTMLLETVKDGRDFIALAAYIRDRVNPFLFQYAYAVVVQHTGRLPNLPPVLAQFPFNFIEPSIVYEAQEETRILGPAKGRKPRAIMPSEDPEARKIAYEVPFNFTASNRDEEQRMAYFREDIGVNMHHWHWHLVFPNSGPREFVDKDRRGELFMYMHNQIIARYNLERFCNDLGKTVPLANLRDVIPEGYFPKLLQTVTKRTYPERMPGQKLKDINRPNFVTTINDLERWIDRISNAIDRGYVMSDQGKRIDLDEKSGMDILGNIIESSELSVNQKFYGDLHNRGHVMVSYIHDPDLKYLEDYGVMGDITTAMRDPIFYRWHSFIDGLGASFKARLPPYSHELENKNITIKEVEVRTVGKDPQPTVVRTFWQKSDVDIAVNLDFYGHPDDGSATFRFTHLSYELFEYHIEVENKGGLDPTKATCRIFILPVDDDPMVGLTLDDQRLMAVEMDRFPVTLHSGVNHIHRRCVESSVTVPFLRLFRPRDDEDIPRECIRNFCSCGWPNHMLLPKGTAAGKVFKLFVMISSDVLFGESDLSVRGREGSPYSFCGLKDKRYPDPRSMGFPFDRKLPAKKLDALLKAHPNMKTCDLKIVFDERVDEVVIERNKHEIPYLNLDRVLFD